MSIIICALKFVELMWGLSITRVMKDEPVSEAGILKFMPEIIFTLAIVIPITWIICKKIKTKKEYISSSIILIVYTFLWTGLLYGSYKLNYSGLMTLTRFYIFIATLQVTFFCILKGNAGIDENDIDINKENEQ